MHLASGGYQILRVPEWPEECQPELFTPTGILITVTFQVMPGSCPQKPAACPLRQRALFSTTKGEPPWIGTASKETGSSSKAR